VSRTWAGKRGVSPRPVEAVVRQASTTRPLRPPHLDLRCPEWGDGLVAEQLDDEHILRRVALVAHHPVDNTPRPRPVVQVDEVTEFRFVNADRAVAARDLRRVELANLTFSYAPLNDAHAGQRGKARMSSA